jgi:hypothetical protein
MRASFILAAGLLAGLLTSAPDAQLYPGDLVITYSDVGVSPNVSDTVKLDLATGKVTTLVSRTQAGTALGNWIEMARNNKDVWVAYQGTNVNAIWVLDQAGALLTTRPLTWRTDGFRFSDDGGVTWSVILTPYSNTLIRTDEQNFANITTLVTGPLPASALSHQEIEEDGTYAASSQGSASPSGAVSQIDAVNDKIIKTIGGLGSVNTVEYHKGNGKVYATEFGAPSSSTLFVGSLFEVDFVTGKVTSLIDATTPLGATVDRLNWLQYQRDHTLLLGARHQIFKYDVARQQIVRTWTFEADRNKAITGAVLYGSRPLIVDTTGGTRPGTKVPVILSFPHNTAPGASYFLACSLALRPGIPVGGERLDLAPDPLFYASAQNMLPTVFQNFRGILNSAGQTTAVVNLPPVLALDGLRVFCGGLAIIGSATVVTNVEGFTIRK